MQTKQRRKQGQRRGVSPKRIGPKSYAGLAFERARLLHRKIELDRLAAWHLFNRLLDRRPAGPFGGIDLALARRHWETLDQAYHHADWLRRYFWTIYRKECIREGKPLPRLIRARVPARENEKGGGE